MATISEYPTATPESVWAALRELTVKQAETERILTEKFAETDRLMQKSNEDFDRLMKESRADYEKRMKNLEDRVGSWSTNHGFFAEEYFFNSFDRGNQNFFGEKFDRIEKNIKGVKRVDEYDILLINGKSLGIIEVKYKAHENDVPKVLKKAETFRINFPKYANHRVYLGLATMAFYPKLEQACINEGIAVIKQVGDTVVVNDKHLKVF